MLSDSMTDTEVGKRQIYWFEEVNSTMDKARELASEVDLKDVFAVVAESQTNGRGTRGRTWMSGANNLLITISIPLQLITIPLTLTPLRVGTLIRPLMASRVLSNATVYLKWPNDILIDTEKVCGVLIEVDNNRMLVGIGCNIGSAPIVDSQGQQSGRPSTCLANHNPNIKSYTSSSIHIPFSSDSIPDGDNSNINNSNSNEMNNTIDPPHHRIAKEIVESIKIWLSQVDSASKIVQDFQTYMDFRPQKLRRSYEDGSHHHTTTSITSTTSNRDVQVDGETTKTSSVSVSTTFPSDPSSLEVVPIRINSDGTLQVRFVQSGEERTLIADYLY